MAGGGHILRQARESAGLSQQFVANRAGTSRPTLSAYERGRKSPTLVTAARIVAASGFDLSITPHIEFRKVAARRGRPFYVPTALPRLRIDRAFATVVLPLHLNWSALGHQFDLGDRSERAHVYEIVLREGQPEDFLAYLDGALLIDLWNALVVPREIRAAWQPLIDRSTQFGAGVA